MCALFSVLTLLEVNWFCNVDCFCTVDWWILFLYSGSVDSGLC